MRTLPDVASDLRAETPSTLQWVGMEEIAVPVSLKIDDQMLQTVAAKANVYVSLDEPETKGIHMSRLHSVLNSLAGRECNKLEIEQLLNEIIKSQVSVSRAARIELAFDVILNKPALLSGERGYQSYPVRIKAEKLTEDLSVELEITIPYSSTCPCSASLARQLVANEINSNFTEKSIDKADLLDWIQSPTGSVATPHSQRSYAYIRMVLINDYWPDLATTIFKFEELIGTPVQTVVKRTDEQEFARLNAENLMFCEDAARRLKAALEQMKFVSGYWLKVEHQESLHAHNAVVIDQNQP